MQATRRRTTWGLWLAASTLLAVGPTAAADPAKTNPVEADSGKPNPAKGERIARDGLWSIGVPACASCHGPRGLGVGKSFPPLAGKAAPYVADQLKAWKAGRRTGDPNGLMRGIAAKLDDAAIADVAAYYAALDARPAGPAPPPAPDIAPKSFEAVVARGEAIFRDPGAHAGAYVGNRLRCSSCHLDAGRLAESAPLGQAYVKYPAFRTKTGKVNTYAERLQGCFRYSMNGREPPLGDPVLVALEAYSYALAKGMPTGQELPGRGYPKLAKPAGGLDYARGAEVYGRKCALCHGADGAGQSADGAMTFPALWGPQSFNWGAGMERIGNAAGFIKANMPFSQGGSLSDQEAWDLALFIDSHDRPQDPRFTGDVAATRKAFHDTPDSMYGRMVDGRLLGAASPPPGPRP